MMRTTAAIFLVLLMLLAAVAAPIHYGLHIYEDFPMWSLLRISYVWGAAAWLIVAASLALRREPGAFEYTIYGAWSTWWAYLCNMT